MEECLKDLAAESNESRDKIKHGKKTKILRNKHTTRWIVKVGSHVIEGVGQLHLPRSKNKSKLTSIKVVI